MWHADPLQSKEAPIQHPLLENSSEDVVSQVTREHAIMERFLCGPCRGYNYNEDCSSVVVNTSTVILRVVVITANAYQRDLTPITFVLYYSILIHSD